jgi:ribonuclease HI
MNERDENTSELNNVVIYITDLVQESCNEVCIVWIPGHSGVEGSERADGLARPVVIRDEVDVALPVSSGENKKK